MLIHNHLKVMQQVYVVVKTEPNMRLRPVVLRLFSLHHCSIWCLVFVLALALAYFSLLNKLLVLKVLTLDSEVFLKGGMIGAS